jgi:hypothetical protein
MILPQRLPGAETKIGIVKSEARVAGSDYGSMAMTPYIEANGESRSCAVRNGIHRVRAPPGCEAFSTTDQQGNLTKEID